MLRGRGAIDHLVAEPMEEGLRGLGQEHELLDAFRARVLLDSSHERSSQAAPLVCGSNHQRTQQTACRFDPFQRDCTGQLALRLQDPYFEPRRARQIIYGKLRTLQERQHSREVRGLAASDRKWS